MVGAGPLGLLATALISLAGARTYVADIVPENAPKALFVQHMGAHYIDASTKTPQKIVETCCPPTAGLNLILEASGAAETAVRLIPHMSRSSIYVMTGIPRGELSMELDGADLVRQIVRFNQVVVGSVNSNRTHFGTALNDMVRINSQYDGILTRMITHRFRLQDYRQAFDPGVPNRIKTVIEVDPW